MPRLDDRLRRGLRLAAEQADPDGVYQRVIEKKVRRRIARRAGVLALTVAVLAGSAGGTFALARAFGLGRARIPRPVASPTGVQNGRIAFSSDRGHGQIQIWTMNPDGSDLRQLTAEPNDATSPAAIATIFSFICAASFRREWSEIYRRPKRGA